MIENTLLSTSQSETNSDVGYSSEDSSKPKVGGLSLSDIPHFTSSKTEQTSPQSLAPPSCIESEPKFEYEFTIFVGRGPLFMGLWDKDDLSACQRASAAHLTKEQITYDLETGVGFFSVRGESWCFKKEPYKRSFGPHNGIEAADSLPPKPKSESANDIIAGI